MDQAEDREDSMYAGIDVDEAEAPPGEFMNENNQKDAEQPRENHGANAEPDPFECSPCDPGREPTSLRSPIRPCQEDVERHYLTHLPYRNWCPVCVRAKAKEDAHRRAAENPEDKSGLPIISLDYAAINDETDKEIMGKPDLSSGLSAARRCASSFALARTHTGHQFR